MRTHRRSLFVHANPSASRYSVPARLTSPTFVRQAGQHVQRICRPGGAAGGLRHVQRLLGVPFRGLELRLQPPELSEVEGEQRHVDGRARRVSERQALLVAGLGRVRVCLPEGRIGHSVQRCDHARNVLEFAPDR